MDQRELVRNGEGGSKDRFVIVLVMHLHDSDKLFEESRQFGAIVMEWYKARGESAERVQLHAVSDPLYHNAIKELFEGLHAMEVQLRAVFKTVPFKLTLHDAKGTPVQEYDFLPGKEALDGAFAQRLRELSKT